MRANPLLFSRAAPAGVLLALALAVIPPDTAPAVLGEKKPADEDGVKVTVTLGTLPPELEKEAELVKRNVAAAVRLWTGVLECHPDATMEVSFRIEDVVAGDPKKLGFGKSPVSADFNDEKIDGKSVKEQGMASELRTGRDPNGDQPDIEICLQTAYAKREFWWDPEPEKRRKRAPAGKLDAVSVMLHEIGHAIAFNGWLDQKTGERGGVLSTYDRHVIMKDGDFFFNGPEVLKLWRKPVPLARFNNNYHHVGDKGPRVRTPPKLNGDLMTGWNFAWATKYEITPLDIAILKDCGLPVKLMK